jgi:hypothetical protein
MVVYLGVHTLEASKQQNCSKKIFYDHPLLNYAILYN